ncbi:hypothetical protein Q1695_007994 [Nippostrongylus brasiliensis]|nr:hypothetical protein Q1695_007994 [Nippostrongylus brasiliensis]
MPEIIGKLMKPDGSVTTQLEKDVSQALVDLESSADIKAQLRELYIVGVREIEIGNKSVIVVYVPVPQLKQFHKVQVRLVRELEKKFGGKHVLFLAKRRILPKPLRGSKKVPMKQQRPRSRTLTAVHEAWLDEMVFPAEVVGKRTRVKLDGKKLLKVHLDKAQQTNVEHKVDTFVSVYRKLTGKEVVDSTDRVLGGRTRTESMGFSDEDRCYKAEVDEDTESPGKMKDCEIGKEPAKRAPLKRDQTQMCEDDLELAHFYQERVYEREKVRDEELLSFKDWRRRIRAAQLRENARRRKTKRDQDEQKAMEAARLFAEPIRRKAPLPKKLVSL